MVSDWWAPPQSNLPPTSQLSLLPSLSFSPSPVTRATSPPPSFTEPSSSSFVRGFCATTTPNLRPPLLAATATATVPTAVDRRTAPEDSDAGLPCFGSSELVSCTAASRRVGPPPAAVPSSSALPTALSTLSRPPFTVARPRTAARSPGDLPALFRVGPLFSRPPPRFSRTHRPPTTANRRPQPPIDP
ncbi:proline-rich receptor-like protein kinase PERK8 [Rhodamnia argentea]|uniref:Proline-rich receptor-like protein kinase PERK8 n=1 Tax=Rhodamnia argentea TaxID=178133 RepID=A0A8B8NBQ5_9MYRT|nr:proline-rich receptor-like protein kinase PERK8 [Rhodamnia argentea]